MLMTAKAAREGFESGAKTSGASIALGVGLTNEGNLKCAFCYRDPLAPTGRTAQVGDGTPSGSLREFRVFCGGFQTNLGCTRFWRSGGWGDGPGRGARPGNGRGQIRPLAV